MTEMTLLHMVYCSVLTEMTLFVVKTPLFVVKTPLFVVKTLLFVKGFLKTEIFLQKLRYFSKQR